MRYTDKGRENGYCYYYIKEMMYLGNNYDSLTNDKIIKYRSDYTEHERWMSQELFKDFTVYTPKRCLVSKIK
jgi:hypothetical protein